jgi:2',3'-cyclic-nucleotide 2'-phosphodiesterase/3'-nucleotidase
VQQLSSANQDGFEVKAADNWHLKPLPAKTKVYFYSSPNPEVEKLAGPTLKRVEGVVANDPKFANHAVYQLLGK